MKPRTLCACQSVAFMISARVAPLGRPIISMIFAPLLSARGELVLFAAAGLAAFFALASFFGAGAFVLARLAAVGPLGALFGNGDGFGGCGCFGGLHDGLCAYWR